MQCTGHCSNHCLERKHHHQLQLQQQPPGLPCASSTATDISHIRCPASGPLVTTTGRASEWEAQTQRPAGSSVQRSQVSCSQASQKQAACKPRSAAGGGSCCDTPGTQGPPAAPNTRLFKRCGSQHCAGPVLAGKRRSTVCPCAPPRRMRGTTLPAHAATAAQSGVRSGMQPRI